MKATNLEFFLKRLGKTDGKKPTIGDEIQAVMAIDNATDARRYYDGYVEWLMERFTFEGDAKASAEVVARSNIGWCFGEGMKPELMKMWNETCRANHPVFGTTMPERPEIALEMGRMMGESLRRGKG